MKKFYKIEKIHVLLSLQCSVIFLILIKEFKYRKQDFLNISQIFLILWSTATEFRFPCLWLFEMKEWVLIGCVPFFFCVMLYNTLWGR